jgi:hypothetical protein
MPVDRDIKYKAVVEALTAWWDDMSGRGQFEECDFPTSTIIRLANGAVRDKLKDTEVVATKLTQRLAPLADEILAVVNQALSGHHGGSSGTGEAQAPPSSTDGTSLEAKASQPPVESLGSQGPISSQTTAPAASSDRVDNPCDVGLNGANSPRNSRSDEKSFTSYASASEGVDEEVEPVQLSYLPDGTNRVAWPRPPLDGQVHIFRLVGADGNAKPSVPERGVVLSTTTDNQAIDSRPYSTVRRYYAVFRNSGQSEEQARDAKPVVVARGLGLGRLDGFRVTEAYGVIRGTWTAPPGTKKIHVHWALSSDYAERSIGEEVPGGPFSADGFVHHRPPEGQTVVYTAEIEYQEDGQTLKSYSAHDEISVPIRRAWHIQDLKVDVESDGQGETKLDMSWTQPNPPHQSRIYVFEKLPQEAYVGAQIPVEQLEKYGFSDEYWWRGLPVEVTADGQCHLRGVPWPDSTELVYVVPLAVGGEKACVGQWVSQARKLGEIRQPVIRDRVNHQIVSFEWPTGADAIEARFTSLHASPPEDSRPPEDHIGRHEYEQAGGFSIAPERFASQADWSIHLSPVRYQPHEIGPPTSLPYQVPSRIKYWIEWQHFRTTKAGRKRPWPLKAIPPETELVRSLLHIKAMQLREEHQKSLRFVLVVKPTRRPLWPDDTDRDGGKQIPAGTVRRLEGQQECTYEEPPDILIRPLELTPGKEALFWLDLLMGDPGSKKGPHTGWHTRLFVDTQEKPELPRLVVLEGPFPDREKVPPPPTKPSEG